MHIPEGYLSPATAAVLYAAAAPFWYRATQKVKPLLTGRFVPLIALFAAFSFVVMMFNIPLPGGTTGNFQFPLATPKLATPHRRTYVIIMPVWNWKRNLTGSVKRRKGMWLAAPARPTRAPR